MASTLLPAAAHLTPARETACVTPGPDTTVGVPLVLGGGGLAGTAFHAGLLSATAERGWDARDADVVVGTSAGSTSAAPLRRVPAT
jgi:predicted acylesterase/phospholipase RssA